MASNGISAQVRRSQSLRRQMTADIAHDFKPSSRRLQTLHVEALHFEARQLERRVSDLRTLSLAATGRNFRALYRADEARSSAPEGGSRGQGLASSRALVVAQQGTLGAESAGVGRRSVFWVEFPLEDKLQEWANPKYL